MNRDWTAAQFKRTDHCRVCGKPGQIELAHVIGRSRDAKKGEKTLVNPDSVVPLCGPATTSTTCHGKYDAGRLDLMPHLLPEEQVQAVADAGGIEAARRRIMGSEAYRKEAA